MAASRTHLDPYISTISSLHALDARLKLCALLIFMLTAAWLPAGAWAAYILLAAVLISAMLLAHVPLRLLLHRSLTIELPFVLMVLPLLFRSGGVEIVRFQAAGKTLALTDTGLVGFLSILVKTWLSIQAAVLVSAVTRFEDVLVGLRGLGYPKLLNAVLALMWRYAFILAAEARRMLAARTARSGRAPEAGGKGGGALIWRMRVTGGMAGSLLLRSLERGERVYQAMKARGYNGETCTLVARQLSAGEKWMIAAMVMLAMLLLLAASQIYRG
jgi:cobalt/nickel transport system permease protein